MPRRYGWRGAAPTNWATPVYKLAAPTKVDHVAPMTLSIPIRDQGDLGSCTGFGSARAVQATLKTDTLSPLFSYFLGRVREATQDVDAGASVSDVLAGIKEYGLASEIADSYDPARFAQRPSVDAFADAMTIRGKINYQRIVGSAQVKHALASGHVVVFGFSVPDYFESDEVAQTGWVRLPTDQDQFIGGHCVIADGFDSRIIDDPEPFAWCPNSWGAWGINGYFKLAMRWFDDKRRLVDDAFVVTVA